MVEGEPVRIEQRCGNCFFAVHYSPGDKIEPRDGGRLKVTREFYERQCVTRVGRFLRRLTHRNNFEPAVLAEKDDGCVTGRFMEKS